MITGLPALLRMLLGLDGAQVAFSHLRAIYTTSGHRCVPTSMLAQRPAARLQRRAGVRHERRRPANEWFLPRLLPDGPSRLPIGYPNPDLEFA